MQIGEKGNSLNRDVKKDSLEGQPLLKTAGSSSGSTRTGSVMVHNAQHTNKYCSP